MKVDLSKINAFFAGLSDEEKEGGLMRFASQVPPCGASLIEAMRKRLGFEDSSHNENLAPKIDPEAQQRLLLELNAFTKGKAVKTIPTDPEGGDTLSITRLVAKKKGSGWQLPKNLRGDLDDE